MVYIQINAVEHMIHHSLKVYTESKWSAGLRNKLMSLTIVFLLVAVTTPTLIAAQPHPYHSDSAVEVPRLFAPDIISTDQLEYGITFSPDGQSLYFTRRASWRDNPAIYVSHFKSGSWQEPQVVSFSGEYADEYPSMSPDGSAIFFASKRPTSGGETLSHNDIWKVERTNSGWGQPEHLPSPINSDDIDSHPFVSHDGTLYFHSRRQNGTGGVDMYAAPMRNGKFGAPQLLSINSPETDGEAVIDPEGKFLIFYSERSGTLGNGDLFVANRENGVWTKVRNPGSVVNTAEYEWTPTISPDGRYLFYALLSGNDSDIYQIDLSAVVGNLE